MVSEEVKAKRNATRIGSELMCQSSFSWSDPWYETRVSEKLLLDNSYPISMKSLGQCIVKCTFEGIVPSTHLLHILHCTMNIWQYCSYISIGFCDAFKWEISLQINCHALQNRRIRMHCRCIKKVKMHCWHGTVLLFLVWMTFIPIEKHWHCTFAMVHNGVDWWGTVENGAQ